MSQFMSSEGLLFQFHASEWMNLDVEGCAVVGIGSCRDTHIVIPAEYEGFPVVAVGEEAFAGCTLLQSVHIPDSVVHIENSAFAYCTDLTEIELPPFLKTIEVSAFEGCASLTHLELPANIKEICDRAFKGCPIESLTLPKSLTYLSSGALPSCIQSITLEEGNRYYTSKGNCVLKSRGTLIFACETCEIPLDGTVVDFDCALPSKYRKKTWNNGVYVGTEEEPYLFFVSLDDFKMDTVVIHQETKVVCRGALDGCKKLKSMVAPSCVLWYQSRDYGGTISIAKMHITTDALERSDENVYWEPDSLRVKSITYADDITAIHSIIDAYLSPRAQVKLPTALTSIWGYGSFFSYRGLVTWYKDGKYLGSKDNPYLCLVGVKNKIANTYLIHPNTKVIAPRAFEMRVMTSIEIPNGVTCIAESAFAECYNLTSIAIPDSVTSIGRRAFYGCTSLTNIEIPDSVTSIGPSAFEGCTSLTKLEIPDNVTSIGSGAFYGCTNLAKLEIPDSVTSIGGGAFYGCTSLTNIEIPKSITRIEAGVFRGCTNLAKLEIPDSVTSIGDEAFAQCTQLTSMVIPEGVVSLGLGVFWDCEALTSVVLPASLIRIGKAPDETDGDVIVYDNRLFVGCFSLENIVVNEENPVYHSIGGCLIERGTRILLEASIHATIPTDGSVTRLAHGSFRGAIQCKDLYIPKEIVHIPEGALPASLETIVVDAENMYYYSTCNCLIERDTGTLIRGCDPNCIPQDYTIRKIGQSAFSACKKPCAVVIPDGVREIGDYAFADCEGLESVSFPDREIDLGEEAFGSCISLKKVTIPQLRAYSGHGAFRGCTALTDVTFDPGCTFIPGDLFEECRGLERIDIPEGVTGIGCGAFARCDSLREVSIPVTVIHIEEAWDEERSCTITYHGTKKQWRKLKKASNFYVYSSLTVHCKNGKIFYKVKY